MLADPQSVAYPTAGTKSLPAISREANASTYQTDDGLSNLRISHQVSKGNRTRRAIKLTFSKTAADPIIPAQNRQFSMSITLVVDVPTLYGFTVAEQLDVYKGLAANLSASTYANANAFLGGQS